MPTRPTRTRRLWIDVVVLLVAAAGAGVLWSVLAEPPSLEVRSFGTVLPETSSTRAFGVEMVFIGLGLALCTTWAAVLGWRHRHRSVVLVPVVVLACGLASIMAWRVGVPLGPPDPTTLDAAALQVGDTVPLQLAVESVAAFMLWPIGGLLGLMLITWLRDDPPASEDPPATDTASVDVTDAAEPSAPASER